MALEDIHDIFNGVYTVPRASSGGPCTSYLHNYTSGEFFGGHYCCPFLLALSSLSSDGMKGGQFYLLLLCTFMQSVNFVPPTQ